MLVAFVVFCLTCVITGYGFNYFLFESTVPLQVSLDVSRGTAIYEVSNEPGANAALSGHTVVPNERVRLDAQSQSVLLFRDNYVPGRLIGMVTMRLGSVLNLGRAQRPRFEWSSLGYRIDLTDVDGEFDVYIPHGLDRNLDITLQVNRPTGPVVIYLNGGGNYSVSATASEVSVFNRDGQRAVVTAPGVANRLVPNGERALVNFEADAAEVTSALVPVNFLQPANFQSTDIDQLTGPGDLLLSDLIWPWQCGNDGSQPQGRFEFALPDGRPALRLVRGEGATSNGRVTCSQAPGPSQTGRDVTMYSSMTFKMAFYIEGQSVMQCGIEGSECPLTLTFDYIYHETLDDGTVRERPEKWYHGFYVQPDPNRSLPVRCLSCQVDHDYVYPGTWYTYESPNLFSLFPENQRPVSLLRVGFYASGHEYDVYVGDMALYAQ